MCGIFGLISKINLTSLATINPDSILQHRGPDDTGWLLYDGKNVTIGKKQLPDIGAKLFLLHKRLSILDLSDLGWQPMACNNHRYYLIFNGEIYNYLELREELLSKGVNFISKTDSEVLLKAYIYWGKECLKKITGMFSFVIFDKKLQKLFIARDHFGIKPFYYYADEKQILFASEIKSLLEYLPIRKINPQRLFHYLRSGMTDFGQDTLLAGIKQLSSGHYLEIDLNHNHSMQSVCYWELNNEINYDITFQEAAQRVQNLFLRSVGFHLRSDVSVAATLSGGIDSSSIVMAIRHLYPDLNIHTLSYIADEDNLNEEQWIDIINHSASAVSHKVFAKPENLIEDLEQLIATQDEPFGSTSIYAQHQVFKAAANQGIKVMLDGQGADEMLGGYTFYVAAKFVSLLKKYKFNEAIYLLKQSRPYMGNTILYRSLGYLLPAKWQAHIRRLSGKSYVPSWINTDWVNQNLIQLKPVMTEYGNEVLKEELLHTFRNSSLPMLLRYEDRNSMSFSIESRVPFLSKDLVEFIFSLPEHFLIAGNGLSKAVFREAMKGIVPESVLNRRDKIGFATPERKWLLHLKPWVEKILMSEFTRQIPVFHYKSMLQDWHNMLQGKSAFDFRFWRWINFIKWSELHQIDV